MIGYDPKALLTSTNAAADNESYVNQTGAYAICCTTRHSSAGIGWLARTAWPTLARCQQDHDRRGVGW